MIDYMKTIRLALAIALVTVAGWFGLQYEPKVNLDECGYAIVKDRFVEIHTQCKITVRSGNIPKVEIEDNMIDLTIPKGWKWRIIP